FHPDGRLEPLTPVGEYTNFVLMLWRPQLCAWRAKMHGFQAGTTQNETILVSLSNPQETAGFEPGLAKIQRRNRASCFRPPARSRPSQYRGSVLSCSFE